MNYNYVILGSSWDLYKCSYADVMKLDCVKYITPESLFGKWYFLFKMHLSPKTNRFLRLPFKRYWLRYFDVIRFDNDNPICFLLFADWSILDLEIGILSYLKKKYPYSKFVVFYQDIIGTKKQLYNDLPLDINDIKKRFDLVLSYDMGDVQKYNIEYHPTVYSKIEFVNSQEAECDVLFIGKAKDRLNFLVEICNKLTSLDVKCKFIVSGVEKNKRIPTPGIEYIDGLLTYPECLKHTVKAKCLLETLQFGATGFTFRVWEAIAYNKKILTNNKAIINAPFFDEDLILLFENTNSISRGIKDRINNANNDYSYKDKISPNCLLEFINNKISKI